jgi:hypothetical protein
MHGHPPFARLNAIADAAVKSHRASYLRDDIRKSDMVGNDFCSLTATYEVVF